MKKKKMCYHSSAFLFGFFGVLVSVAPATAGNETIDPPGSTNTHVTGIDGNNVVGLYRDSSNVIHGFEYNGTTFTTIDVSGATNTKATCLSGNNVVGYYTNNPSTDLFVVYHGFESQSGSSTVPEPTSAALLGLGGICLSVAAYRRRSTAA